MHELSLAQELMHIADRAAQAAGAKEVVRVRVGVGWLMQVEQQSLSFYLEVLRQEYPRFVRAEFELHPVPAVLRCRSCGAETERTEWPLACGACDGSDVQVISVAELEVQDMEVLVDDV